MTMPRAPAARPSSSAPLQHPPWNGTLKVAQQRGSTSASTSTASGEILVGDYAQKPHRHSSSQRKATPATQRTSGPAVKLRPEAPGRVRDAPDGEPQNPFLLRSPDAFELARAHTSLAVSHDLATTPLSIFQTFLAPQQGPAIDFGPALPDWAEAQCCSSALDEDMDTQLHQLQLRLAATRDLLRASAPSQDARRRLTKGHQAGSGGLTRYTYRSDIRKKVVASAAAADDEGLVSHEEWAPPILDMKFPWDDASTTPAAAAADQRPSSSVDAALVADSHGGGSVLGSAVIPNADPSTRLKGAYHRYFGEGGNATAAASTAAAKKQPHQAMHDTLNSRTHEYVNERQRRSGGRRDSAFDPLQYAHTILRRHQGNALSTSGAALSNEDSFVDIPQHPSTGALQNQHNHRRAVMLMSPPRDEHLRHHGAATFGVTDDEKFFDDDDGNDWLQPAFDRSGQVAPHRLQSPMAKDNRDSGLLRTPRSELHLPRGAQQPLPPSAAPAVDLLAPLVPDHPNLGAAGWSASVASVLESINFANSSHPVMLPTTVVSGWSGRAAANATAPSHRSASLRDEGEYVMARDVMSMLRH